MVLLSGESSMEMQQDEIVDIPPHRVKYFGTTGKMLLPSPTTIAAAISKIPAAKLITTSLLRQHLTEQFNVQGTCPVTTQKALREIANNPQYKVAYWRVINQSGGLLSNVPGGAAGHAAHLKDEGFTINTSGKAPKVDHFKQSLIRLN